MPTLPKTDNLNISNVNQNDTIIDVPEVQLIFPPARPEHPIPVVRQPENTRYKVQSRLQSERKVDDYLRLLIKITQKSQFALQLKSNYDTFITNLRKYTSPAIGEPPAMTQDGIQALLKDLEKAYDLAYQALQYERKRKKPLKAQPVHVQVLRDVSHALEKDFRTLRSLQPDGKMTLPQLVKASKGRTIRLSSDLNEIQKVGCAVSSRMLLSVKDGAGNVQNGVFTKAYGVGYEPVAEAIEKFKAEKENLLKSQDPGGQPDQALIDFMNFFDFMERKRQAAEEADDCTYSVGEFYVLAFNLKENKAKRDDALLRQQKRGREIRRSGNAAGGR